MTLFLWLFQTDLETTLVNSLQTSMQPRAAHPFPPPPLILLPPPDQNGHQDYYFFLKKKQNAFFWSFSISCLSASLCLDPSKKKMERIHDPVSIKTGMTIYMNMIISWFHSSFFFSFFSFFFCTFASNVVERSFCIRIHVSLFFSSFFFWLYCPSGFIVSLIHVLLSFGKGFVFLSGPNPSLFSICWAIRKIWITLYSLLAYLYIKA